MDLVWQIVGWLSIPVTVVSVLYSVLTWRREHRLTSAGIWIPIVVSALSLWFYTSLIGLDPNPLVLWLPFAATLALGLYVGQTDGVVARGDVIVASRSPWSFVAWAVAFAVTQLVALLAPGATESMLGVLFAATGLTIGEQLALAAARSSELGKMHAVAAGAGIVIAVLALGTASTTPRGFAADVSADIGDVAGMRMENGTEVAPSLGGVSVEIHGTEGGGWSGSSIDVTVTNTTADTMRIRVPVGTRLYPDDAGVQTMLAAGNEVIEVPPGTTVTETIQAYCGEAHDSPPHVSNSFTVGEPVSGPLLDTLEEAARRRSEIMDPESGVTENDVQQAVWTHTNPDDREPPLEGTMASEFYRPPTDGPTEEQSGKAGGSTGAVAAAGAVLGTRPNRRRNGGAAGGDGSVPDDGSPPWGEADDTTDASAETSSDDTGATTGRDGQAADDSTSSAPSTTEPTTEKPPVTTPPAPSGISIPGIPVTYDPVTDRTTGRIGGTDVDYTASTRSGRVENDHMKLTYDGPTNTGQFKTKDGKKVVNTRPGHIDATVKGANRTTSGSIDKRGDTTKVHYEQTGGGRGKVTYDLELSPATKQLIRQSGGRRETLVVEPLTYTRVEPGLSVRVGEDGLAVRKTVPVDFGRVPFELTPGVAVQNGTWHPSLGVAPKVRLFKGPCYVQPGVEMHFGPGHRTERFFRIGVEVGGRRR